VKLAGRIPVVPLDEDRLIKIERGVVAGAADAASRGHGFRVQRRYAGHAFAGLAVVAAGVIGWALRGAPASGPVAAEPAPLQVQTGPRRSVLDIGDARIESDRETVFAVTRPSGGVLVAMTRGKLELAVGKRGGRPPLIVRAGDTDVVVVGTRFSVDYGDGRGEVDVRVTEGVVRVVHLQQETRVAAGQAWQTRAGLIASADPPRAEAANPPVPGPGPGDSGPTVMPAHDGTAVALGQPPDVLHDRKAAVPDAPGGTAPQPPRAAPPSRPAGSAPVRARVAVRPSDPQVDLRSAIRAQRIEPALEIGEPNASSAVTRYYDIAAHRSGEEASQAFYSIAAVQYLRLARSTDALDTLDAYVRRFPGGKEYRAVLWLRVRILCLDKIDDRCRAAAYTYLHQAPHDPAAHVAEQLTMAE
jgi:hypothetical protein